MRLFFILFTIIALANYSSFAQSSITQGANNSGDVTGTAGDNVTLNAPFSDLTGLGLSLSVNTTGASTSVSVLGIAVDFNPPGAGIGNVNQTSENTGTISTPSGLVDLGSANILGSGTTISVGTSGSVAAFSLTGINGASAFSSFSVGNINQSSSSDSGDISNTGVLSNIANVTGHGVSLSISASGAVAVVSTTFIGSEFAGLSFGNIVQDVDNGSDVSNSNGGFVIGTGLNTDGSSASASATGAVSSVSLTSILNTGAPGTLPSFGNISQTTDNTGSIINNGGTISSGTITGNGTSISISAVGAVSSVAYTSITDSVSIAGASFGAINQQSTNTGAITNAGTAIVDNTLTGNGASVSVSALGAGAATSFTAINN